MEETYFLKEKLFPRIDAHRTQISIVCFDRFVDLALTCLWTYALTSIRFVDLCVNRFVLHYDWA